MNQFVYLAFQVTLICALLFCCCEATSITLSPLGMVSVCPGGQVLLTCERISGSILFWDVFVPVATIFERIVLSQGSLFSPDFRIGFTEFNISRTSDNPLVSQLLISNVTTDINVFCSEDGDETNSPMTAIHKDNTLQSVNCTLDVSLMKHFLRNSVTVTLQWPRETGAVYNVSVSPLTEFTNTKSHDSVVINLTISYNIQYNVSIVSSLCGITTTKVLNYVTCDHPPTQSLQDRVMIVDRESDIPIMEGQFITYTCPSGFILTGPNASVCMRNREWEPDPGEVDCIADCGVPPADRNIKLVYSSTLEGSVLTLTCENEMFNMSSIGSDAEILNVTCDSNGRWIPDPANFIQFCSLFSATVSPTTDAESSMTVLLWTPVSSILIAVCAISSIVFLSIGYACGWFSHKHKKSRTRKAASDSSVEENTGQPNERSQLALPPAPGPLYEELLRSTPEHQDLVELKENIAYGPIIK